jgi:predicted GTPase
MPFGAVHTTKDKYYREYIILFRRICIMNEYLAKQLIKEMNEMKLESIDNDTIELLERIDLYTTVVDTKYENSLRDMQLINAIKEYNNEITNLINKINDVESEAIKYKQENLMFTCEGRKAQLVNIMIYLQEKYL